LGGEEKFAAADTNGSNTKVGNVPSFPRQMTIMPAYRKGSFNHFAGILILVAFNLLTNSLAVCEKFLRLFGLVGTRWQTTAASNLVVAVAPEDALA
jgi:hypothetical protein